MFQLMPLPLTVSCSSKIQIGFTFLVPAHLGIPGQRAVKRVCVLLTSILILFHNQKIVGVWSTNDYKGANCFNSKRIWICATIKQLRWTIKICSNLASYPAAKAGYTRASCDIECNPSSVTVKVSSWLVSSRCRKKPLVDVRELVSLSVQQFLGCCVAL